MPNIIKKYGFRLFFYSNERNEPLHVHVEKAGNLAKFLIKPIKLLKNEGFKTKEIRKIIEIIFEYQINIEGKWNEHFNK